MTNEQRAIFSKMLDLNYEAKRAISYVKKVKLYQELEAQTVLLKEAMGEQEYNKFIRMGKEMFAPKS